MALGDPIPNALYPTPGHGLTLDLGGKIGTSRLVVRDYTEVTKSAVQSINNVTVTTVTFDTETIDDNNQHDNATNNSRITFSAAGLFVVGAFTTWPPNGTGGRVSRILLNGATILAADDASCQTSGLSQGDNSLFVPHYFSAKDYIELVVYQNSGVALNLAANSTLWALRCSG